nr:unnamed protein product [Callosobruchus analis]
MAAIDSPVGIPVKGEVIGTGRGYRDPTKFRYAAFPKPTIDVCPQVEFTRSKYAFIMSSKNISSS